MHAKIIYFNHNRASRLNPNTEFGWRVTLRGDFYFGSPGLYDYVGDISHDVTDGEELANIAFRAFNRVEVGDMAGLRIRSMCVGDALLLDDGTLIVCKGIGWETFPAGMLDAGFHHLPKVDRQDN